MDGAPAAVPTPDVDQHHLCFLFQEVLLRGLDDVSGPAGDPLVFVEKRRQRH